MSPRRAAALLGVPENADPSSIRAAYARSVRFVHPDGGYRGADSSQRIAELQQARSVLESRSMQLSRSSGYYYHHVPSEEELSRASGYYYHHVPSDEEIQRNPASRSARLRVLEFEKDFSK